MARATLWLFSEAVNDQANLRQRLLEMDGVSLRALIRQCAHQIDNGSQRYVLSPEQTKARMARARTVLRAALSVYDEEGYSTTGADVRYAREALRRGDDFEKTPVYTAATPGPAFSPADLKAVERAITGRRSVRRFAEKEVPEELVERVLEAATWAPCACSLQAVRFAVLKDAGARKLIAQPWSSPVIILAGFDERPYEFIKGNEVSFNSYIDVGAAVQNLLLMDHALGLGACVGTFSGELGLIRRELKVPDYVQLITYIALGWPDDRPETVPRAEMDNYILYRR